MSKWPLVPLGDVLTKSEDWVALEPERQYNEVTIRLWGKGIVLRRQVIGAEIASDRRLRVRANQFILSRIDARNGAIGLVPESLDGAVVSADFPTFALNAERVFSPYLGWMSRTPAFVEICKKASEGTTNRVRLQEDRFLQKEIPLPPFTEQRRIVARIESLSAKIEEAHGLRQQTDEETRVLAARTCSQILDNPRWEFKRLEFVLAETPRNGLSPQRETETNGHPMLRINAVSSTPSRFVDVSAYKNIEVSEDVAGPFVLQHDDVFIVRYNGDINRVAKAAIFKGEKDTKIVYPDKLMRLRTDMKKMLPDFLVFALGSRTVREQIEELGKTTAGQIGVSGADAKSFVVPVPPVEEQRRIVVYLDNLHAKVDALKKLQTESAAELAALLPAILDKAFKGELVA